MELALRPTKRAYRVLESPRQALTSGKDAIMPKATCISNTAPAAPPVPMDLDAELAVMAGVHAALAPLDYEARVRVLAWLARRFDVDTDALRF